MIRRKAFTLIELLVVISIIALLMAILIPSLSKARKQAKDLTCLARLEQWGVAFGIYCQENDGKFINSVHFTENPEVRRLVQYDEMLYCPLATKPLGEGGVHPFAVSWMDDGRPADTSYGVNLWVGCAVGGGRDEMEWEGYCWNTTYMSRPYEVPLFMDCLYDDKCDLTPYHWDQPPEYDGQLPNGNQNEIQRVCMDRHNGGIHCLFVDFNARKVGLKELWELRWSRKWFTDPYGKPDHVPPSWPRWMARFRDYR